MTVATKRAEKIQSQNPRKKRAAWTAETRKNHLEGCRRYQEWKKQSDKRWRWFMKLPEPIRSACEKGVIKYGEDELMRRLEFALQHPSDDAKVIKADYWRHKAMNNSVVAD